MPHPTVLVTHSLRTYQEAFASWLRRQRPALSVAECEPPVLDLAGARYDPCLVMCEVPTPSMRRERLSLSWIELHPHGGMVSLVHLGGQERSIPDLALSDILRLVDMTKALLWPVCSSGTLSQERGRLRPGRAGGASVCRSGAPARKLVPALRGISGSFPMAWSQAPNQNQN